jgi:hypothetical protein
MSCEAENDKSPFAETGKLAALVCTQVVFSLVKGFAGDALKPIAVKMRQSGRPRACVMVGRRSSIFRKATLPEVSFDRLRQLCSIFS